MARDRIGTALGRIVFGAAAKPAARVFIMITFPDVASLTSGLAAAPMNFGMKKPRPVFRTKLISVRPCLTSLAQTDNTENPNKMRMVVGYQATAGQ